MTNVIIDTIDMTYLSWSKHRESSGTAGSFLKAYEEIDNVKTYYKMSNYNSYDGVIGYENINEIIVDRLLNVLSIKHLSYELIHAKVLVDDKEFITWISSSKDFKQKGDSKISLELYYESEKNYNESVLEFCKRKKFDKTIYEMLVVDYIILNRDRHGANIEVIRSSKDKTLKIAPLFDHGFSLLYQCKTAEDASKVDLLSDSRVQCFVGSDSTYNNLKLIPKNKLPKLKPLKYSDKEYILKDLDNAIDSKLLDYIFEMIYKRYNEYENFRNQK